MKPWYWELQRAGWGPHLYLSLEFAPQDGPVLRQLLSDSPPQGFKSEPRTEGNNYSWSGLSLEEDTLMWGKEGNGQWGFAFLLLTGAKLDFEHGWGSQGEVDSVWLRRVLGGERITLQKWSMGAGGEGYSPTYGRSGRDRNSFLASMKGEVAAPNWRHVEAELRRVLSQHDPQGKFTIGECVVGEGGDTLKVTVLYDVPRTEDGRGWRTYPADTELLAIASEVGEGCGVPYRASSVSERAPHDWEQFIGGSILFGIRSRR